LTTPAPLKKLNLLLDGLLAKLVAATSIFFFSVVLISVFARYVIKAPVLASIELSRITFVWSCMLAAALTYRQGAHIAISFLFERSPRTLQKWLNRLTHVLVLAFSILVLWQSTLVVWLLWPTDLPMLEISQSWFYIPLPFVCLIICLFTVEFLLDDRQDRSEEAERVP
jgi:TRAP-type C4-dicarboxylate transport system permease small subunit